jgi:hypothetical protein
MMIDLTPAEREANDRTHRIGYVDDCLRCVDCEIAAWNTWKVACDA